MPPKRSDALQLDARALTRSLCQLRLKLASFKGGPSGSIRECARAAEELDKCMAHHQDAQKLSSQAGPVLDDIATTLGTLRTCQHLPDNLAWRVLRSLIRLVLWLLPEHLPLPPSEPAAAAPEHPRQQATRSTAVATDQDIWRHNFDQAYVAGIAMPRLLAELVTATKRTAVKTQTAPEVEAQLHGTVEECLTWLALFNRLRTLASELQVDARVSSLSAPQQHTSSKAGTFATYLLSLIQRLRSPLLFMATHAINFLALSKQASMCPLTKPAPVLAQDIVSLLSSRPLLDDMALRNMDFEQCAHMCEIYGLMLRRVLPSGTVQLGATHQQDFLACLPLHVETSLRGLTLMFRTLLGWQEMTMMAGQWWHAAMSVSTMVQSMVTGTLMQVSGLLTGPAPWESLLYLPQHLAAGQFKDKAGLLGHLARWDEKVKGAASSQQYRPHGCRDWHADWVKVASAAATALQLLIDAAGYTQCYDRLKPSLKETGASAYHGLGHAAVLLVPILRPASHADFSATAACRGWAMSTLAVTPLLMLRPLGIQAGVSTPGTVLEGAIVLRAFLQQVLPVLQHVAALARREGGGRGAMHTCDAPAQMQPRTAVRSGLHGHDVLTCHLSGHCGTATDSQTNSCSSTSAVEGIAPGATASMHPTASSLPAENTLLLLRAAVRIVDSCVTLAVSSEVACKVISQGMQHVGGSPDQVVEQARVLGNAALEENFDSGDSFYRPAWDADDLGTALGAVTTLATALVSAGPWWEEARAHYPLLLIQTLHELIGGMHQVLQAILDAKAPHAALWSCVTGLRTHCSLDPAGPAAAIVKAAGSAHMCDARGEMAAKADNLGGVTTSQDGSASVQGMSITTLVIHLSARLWYLLSDKGICGDAVRHVSWMAPVTDHMDGTVSRLVAMLSNVDDAVRSFLEASTCAVASEQHQNSIAESGAHCTGSVPTTNSSSINGSSSSSSSSNICSDPCQAASAPTAQQQSSQKALRLAALTPAVPLLDFGSAAMGIFSKDNMVSKLGCRSLRSLLCGPPLLRVICMLGQVGCLTDGHKQGIVALLGGVPLISTAATPTAQGSGNVIGHTGRDHICSECTNSNSLLLSEPTDLLEFRQKGDITLGELSIIVMSIPDGLPTASSAATAAQLVMLFGAERLPVAASFAASQPGEHAASEQCGVRKFTEQSLDQAALRDTYLSWVQATLLHVIDDVLSQQQFQARSQHTRMAGS